MKKVYRISSYTLGLFLMAIGVTFSVHSNLGLSPVNSLPYAVSMVVGVSLGFCVAVIYTCFILMQIILLRKEYKPINLLQIVISMLFGFFVDFAELLFGGFVIPTYLGRLAMLAISIAFVAIGLTFYLGAKLIPLPMDGLTLAITKKQKKLAFHQVKVITDSLNVVLAIIVAVVARGHVLGVREGTIISALLVGKVMAFFMQRLGPRIQSVCFDNKAQESPVGDKSGEGP